MSKRRQENWQVFCYPDLAAILQRAWVEEREESCRSMTQEKKEDNIYPSFIVIEYFC